MNKLKYFLFCFTIIGQSFKAQTSPKKEIYNKDFKWTITIPENFQNVSNEEQTRLQNKGEDAIKAMYGEKIVNKAKPILVIKSDQFNYFESNYQPFDVLKDGKYLKSCKNVNNIIYNTFKTQMKNVEIDSASSVEKIDNLAFQTFKIKIKLPNSFILNLVEYSRLFGKREFTVNMLYIDEEKGKQMLDAWKNSKFGK